ncbi:tetratricopeptide repeat protein [Candidatus Micrarchaeota archaeon]|nr:tetratricopeptide repeat protein [Candidatus Micrarchaeota archaeon]
MAVRSFVDKLQRNAEFKRKVRECEFIAFESEKSEDYSIAGKFWCKAAVKRSRKKDLKNAEKAFKKAVENFERVKGSYAKHDAGVTSRMLGDCYRKAGKFEEAITAYGKAAEYISKAEYPRWRVLYGDALRRKAEVLGHLEIGRFEEAVEAYEKALESFKAAKVSAFATDKIRKKIIALKNYAGVLEKLTPLKKE